jgi:hypothetical protein
MEKKPFLVSIKTPNSIHEQIFIIAASSCDAVMRAFELMFGDFDSVKQHGGMKIAVKPVRRAA